MGWDDIMGIIRAPYDAGKDLVGKLGGALGVGSADPSNPYRQSIDRNAQQARAFANQAAGNYNTGTQNIGQDRSYLQGLASGQNSVSAEQLRQGMQQGLAAQQSMAAGARPGNAAMAARNAAMNMGRLGYGLSGQQALAGLQERNQAQQALAGLDLGARGQDVNAAIGGYGAANQGYGAALDKPQQGWGPLLMGGLQGAAQVGAMAASDRRLKRDVEDGDAHASKALKGLGAHLFAYKDEKHGKGKQFGIMAQDLEKHGLGHAVVNTREGKLVHGAKLATAATGLVAALARRVDKLESKDR